MLDFAAYFAFIAGPGGSKVHVKKRHENEGFKPRTPASQSKSFERAQTNSCALRGTNGAFSLGHIKATRLKNPLENGTLFLCPHICKGRGRDVLGRRKQDAGIRCGLPIIFSFEMVRIAVK